MRVSLEELVRCFEENSWTSAEGKEWREWQLGQVGRFRPSWGLSGRAKWSPND
jgi:hypothetical protein